MKIYRSRYPRKNEESKQWRVKYTLRAQDAENRFLIYVLKNGTDLEKPE